MAVITPQVANDPTELRCAQKLSSPVIICTDRNFFIELDKEVSKNKATRKAKSYGKTGLWVGGSLTILSGGLGLIVLAASALGVVGGVALDKFKDYKIVMDYVEKRVIFLKARGKNTFNENQDTIEGIDINSIILSTAK